MIYVSVPATTFSGYLSQLSGAGQAIFTIVDRSNRIVARSQDIGKYMFAAAPAWLTDGSVAEGEVARLSVAGPVEIGGTWDAGYRSLSAVTGWTAVAVQPAEVRFALWSFLSIETLLLLAGLVGSALLLWTNENRKRALRRVRSSEKAQLLAEQQSRDKSQLLATFAHDVRSPLVSMIGSLAVVEESEQIDHNDLRAARSSAEALLQLVDDTLELSYLGSGRFTPQLSSVDLRLLSADLLGQLQSEAQRKGLRLVLNIDQSVPQTVQLDRLRLEQVLRNLVTNGIKYTEEGSVSVRIRATHIQDGVLLLNFIVEDTGVGIAEEDVQKVFREFGRLDCAIERREFGSGLGLAISKRILRAMGSELLVESNLGNGTSFSFVIRSPVTQAVQPVFEAKPLSGITILYAEDEAIIRQLTARQLRGAGATVIEAEDGQVALGELGKKVPDLLLIDIEMPRLDGVETLRRLRRSDPNRRYPIFVLTSHISGLKCATARSLGADEVFTKPVQILPLAAAFMARRGHSGVHTPSIGGELWQADQATLISENFFVLLRSDANALAEKHIPAFEDQMRSDLEQLVVEMAAENYESVKKIAHRCLGVCLVLGAHEISKRLEIIENAADSKEKSQIENCVLDLTGLLERTVQEMRKAVSSPV